VIRQYVKAYEAKVAPVDIPLKVHICGDELITLKNESPLQLSYYINGPGDYETYLGGTVDAFFKNSFPGCPLMKFDLVRNPEGWELDEDSLLGVVVIS